MAFEYIIVRSSNFELRWEEEIKKKPGQRRRYKKYVGMASSSWIDTEGNLCWPINCNTFKKYHLCKNHEAVQDRRVSINRIPPDDYIICYTTSVYRKAKTYLDNYSLTNEQDSESENTSSTNEQGSSAESDEEV